MRKIVRVATVEVAERNEVLAAVGLGSCVAILLHDPERQVAGMAHVLLSHPPNGKTPSNPAKFATTALPLLLERMEAAGADRSRLVARLVGGASMFGALLIQGTLHIGERNLVAARQALSQAGIPILGEEVGRSHGRSVTFRPRDGRAVVTSLEHAEVVL